MRGSGRRVLTDLVSLVRFALEQEDELVPYPDLRRRALRSLARRPARPPAASSRPSSCAGWTRSADHVAASLAITPDDFQFAPFVQQGGLGKAYELFGDELPTLLDELNEALAA